MKLTQRKRTFVVKPIYRVTELASMIGLTKWVLLRTLKKNGVELQTKGRGGATTVTLVALRQAFPDLWESMLLARALGD